jgi:hypothetical protein
MTVTYGFYNSLAGDRVYDAVDFSQIFNGIINDGVFMSVGGKLMVSPNGGLTVKVASGRAWFNGTWTQNDTDLVLTHDAAPVVLSRIDSVVLEVNSSSEIRANSIKIVKGTAASSPVAPTLLDSEYVHQYALADILLGPEVTVITAGNITNKVGTSVTPFVTAILETMDVDSLLAQWSGQFTEWFTDLQNELDSNQAANLQSQITTLETDLDSLELGAALAVKGRPVNSAGTIYNIQAGTDGHVLRRSGDTLGFGLVKSAGIDAAAIIAGKIASGGVSATAQLADNIVDHSKVGLGVPQFKKRKGGNSNNWLTGGWTVYDVGNVMFQSGTFLFTHHGFNTDVTAMWITFPIAFSNVPNVHVTVWDTTNKYFYFSRISAITATDFSMYITHWYDNLLDHSVNIEWLAYGPE